MAKRLPTPFAFRDGWRAQVTVHGRRLTQDFEKGDFASARAWIARQVAEADQAHAPELGGPHKATLAEALRHYAVLYTVNKQGWVSELNRINHYLEGGGLAPLRIVTTDAGSRQVQTAQRAALPRAFAQHVTRRRDARDATYARITELASKRCSTISTADIRRLMADMSREGLSDSTVQKEVALLKHLFNVAAKEWSWTDFPNPCHGVKLGKSRMRFVSLNEDERQRLRQALSDCDNPYVWPFVEILIETALRSGSVLKMRWDEVDLEGRFALLHTKTGQAPIPLSQRAVALLKGLPRERSSRVFPVSANAIDLAWEGARAKAGLPTLQLRDLRHLAATDYARSGMTPHHLQRVLGHKSTRMAEVYVNLAGRDVLEAMDRAPLQNRIQVLPPPIENAQETMRRRRSKRIVEAVMQRLERPTPSK